MTIGDLMEWAATRHNVGDRTVKNRESALNAFCEINGVTLESAARDSLNDPDKINAFLDRYPESRAYKSHIQAWQSLLTLSELENDDSTFGVRLRTALDSKPNINLHQLSSQSGIPEETLKGWLTERCSPSPKYVGGIVILESILDLPLLSLIKYNVRSTARFLCPKRLFPVAYQSNDCHSQRIRRRVREQLLQSVVEHMARSEAEQTEVIAELCKHFDNGRNKQDTNLQSTYRHHFEIWSPQLHRNIDDVTDFTMSEVVQGAFSRNGRVTSPGTIEKYVSDLESFFGYCAASPDAADVLARGLGIKPETFSLAFLTCPTVFEGNIKFHQTRGNKLIGLNSLASLAAKLLHPVTGYLTQSPQYRNELTDHPALRVFRTLEERENDGTSEPIQVLKFLAETGSWRELCVRAHTYYRRFQKSVEADPRAGFERIWPLVNDRDTMPLEFIWNMIGEMQVVNKRLNYPKSTAYSILFRNTLLVALAANMPLRRKHWSRLRVDGNLNHGGLITDDTNGYVFEIPAAEFKNRASVEVFENGRPYRAYLTPLVVELLEEYLAVHRPRLLKQGDHGHLLTTTEGGIFCKAGVSSCFSDITAKFLSENCLYGPGIPGVRPFFIHRMRQIVASDFIKRDHNFTRAAYVLADKESTVRKIYGWLTGDDKATYVLEGFLVSQADFYADN